MAVKIAQVQNLQQLDVLVAGPDDANHLFTIDGQFDTSLTIGSQGTNFALAKETFSVLIGPKLANRQFVRAIATASIVKTQIANIAQGGFATWNIVDVDADWDDESGQVELRIEAQVSCLGSNQSASINGFAFHVTILAALPPIQIALRRLGPRERRIIQRRILLVSEYFKSFSRNLLAKTEFNG